jgi:CTP:molybdopterin cytidylyltransferase MocA
MPDEEFFYHSLVKKFKEYGCETVLVVNEYDYSLIKPDIDFHSIDIAINNRLDLGRLYSLQCGLKQLMAVQKCFVHNIDNPFVSNDLLAQLERGLTSYDYTFPVFESRGGHPLLIGSRIINQILKFNEPFLDFREVLASYSGFSIPFNKPEILQNINTPEDYERFLQKE